MYYSKLNRDGRENSENGMAGLKNTYWRHKSEFYSTENIYLW